MMDNLLNDNIDDFDLDLLDNSFRSLVGGLDTTIGTPSDDPLKSSFTSKSSIDLERMFLEMDNEDPEQLLESMMDSYNPTRSTTDHRHRSGSIIKDELLLDDVNYDPIPYAPVNLGLGPKKRKTREDYKNSRRASCSDARLVSCSDMDNYNTSSSVISPPIKPKNHWRIIRCVPHPPVRVHVVIKLPRLVVPLLKLVRRR